MAALLIHSSSAQGATGLPNKGMKLTKRGELRSFAACPSVIPTSVTEQGTKVRRGAFGGAMRLVGWLCVIGIACVIIEMVTLLPYLENEYAAHPVQTDLGQGQFDIRSMGIMHPGPLGWLGGWGYLSSIAWMPLAAWQAFRAKRQGIAIGLHARVLLVLVLTLFLAAQALLRLTPLKYQYPLV